ncbi:MAG: hypothetical protein L6R41_006531, partial [Letrouitia leprolyta]
SSSTSTTLTKPNSSPPHTSTLPQSPSSQNGPTIAGTTATLPAPPHKPKTDTA